MEIKNKVAIVTGASEGIGAAIAAALAEGGAKVILAARSDDKISALAHELKDAIAVHTDMRNPADIQNLVDRAIAVYGRIDLLVNNAGQGMYGPVEMIDIEKYKDVMELNVYAPLRLMELVIPYMRTQGGGMIVNVSSRVSKNHFPNIGAYASTKYALNGLTLTAREELAKDHIVVSLLHPKTTATNFRKNAFGQSPLMNRPASQMPAIDTPEDVADLFLKLVKSEKAEAEM